MILGIVTLIVGGFLGLLALYAWLFQNQPEEPEIHDE